MIYLACPYSDSSRRVEAFRANLASRMAATLMAKGETVFSPVSHGHSINVVADVGGSFEAWKAVDLRILAVCSKVVVLMLGGWSESLGVRREMILAGELGIPVEMLEPGGKRQLAKVRSGWPA